MSFHLPLLQGSMDKLVPYYKMHHDYMGRFKMSSEYITSKFVQ